MAWEFKRTICRRFLMPSLRRGIRSAPELDYSWRSNSSRGMAEESASRAIANRRSTEQPSASSCRFIQPTSDLAMGLLTRRKDSQFLCGGCALSAISALNRPPEEKMTFLRDSDLGC